MLYSNGGPFVIKYPGGDPAAKGILARLDPTLKPARERTLEVLKEDLTITYSREYFRNVGKQPIISVEAKYTIQNPANREIKVDFGFPIVRGIYINSSSMVAATPSIKVKINGKYRGTTIIANSSIYGMIRRKSREIIEEKIKDNKRLNELCKKIKNSEGSRQKEAKNSLIEYLIEKLKWDKKNAVLLSEYPTLNLEQQTVYPFDRNNTFGWGGWGMADNDYVKLSRENIGILSAIGEKKATQFFAQLSEKFDPNVLLDYESIFKAWGGDIRERSVDIKTGNIRPREITLSTNIGKRNREDKTANDYTIYARVQHLDKQKNLKEEEKKSCKTILKHLPVIFTFSPMNLVCYNAVFPPKSKNELTVTYKQYAYLDTSSPSSYQFSYVLHPASLWDEFGPINLTVNLPENIKPSASVPIKRSKDKPASRFRAGNKTIDMVSYKGTVKSKKGELFLGINADEWKKLFPPPKKRAQK